MAIIKEMQFNDGEGIDYADFNNLQKYLRSEMWDSVVGPIARVVESDVYPSTSHLYCMGNAGHPTYDGTGRDFGNAAGTIIQKVTAGVPTGDTPLYLPYHLATDEIFTAVGALAANSSGSDRYDTIQVKIDAVEDGSESRDFKDATTLALSTTTPNKKYNTRLTASIKSGATEQAPDAGYVKWAVIKVPNGATNLTRANIYDYRMPVGLHVVDVFGRDCRYTASEWTLIDGIAIAAPASTARTAYAIPRYPSGLGSRLVRVGLTGNKYGTPVLSIVQQSLTILGIGIGESTICSVPAATYSHGAYGEMDLLASPGTIPPIWADGSPSPTAQAYTTTRPNVAFKFTSSSTGTPNNDALGFVRFYFAAG